MKIEQRLRPISPTAVLALAILAVSACTTTTPSLSPSPETSATPAAPTPSPVTVATASPPASATESPPAATESPQVAVEPCAAADLELTHSPTDGAAGSRFTALSFVVVGPGACSLPNVPTIALVDATGAQVLVAPPGQPTVMVDYPSGTGYDSVVQFTNWCQAQTAEPLHLVLIVDDQVLPVGGGPFPDPGGLPPCNGPGGPTLDATPWGIPPG